ncbi:hypothetical protein ACPOL_1691 [Acidisarcina polymorpha]|uniref:Uncharacterized protein n=1 Tax=Acidisarcina polymorpha TaxID=2211140 RepID=A0A2Z5FXC7_9BACT|nr:hypothetical protein [Acidisarcina polymorpha]AXC11035.1 hypothetical protein ACPOL_1691 [Acidisarcina polymorpha]
MDEIVRAVVMCRRPELGGNANAGASAAPAKEQWVRIEKAQLHLFF